MDKSNIQCHAMWKKLIAEHVQSGKKQKAFCNEKGVSSSKMSYYRAVFKSQNQQSTTAFKKLTPIEITNPAAKNNQNNVGLKIILPNGFCCEFSEEHSITYVKALMEALLSC